MHMQSIHNTVCRFTRKSAGIIFDKLSAPFTYDMPYCILIWVIMFFPDVAVRLANGQITYAVGIAMMYYVIAWAVVAAFNLHRILRLILKPAVYILLILFTALNIYCIIMYKDRLTHDIVQIVAATNPAEIREYISMYISGRKIILFILYLSASLAVYFAAAKLHVKRNKALVIPQAVFLAASIALISCNPPLRAELYGWNLRVDELVDLRSYKTDPDIEYADEYKLPENIVIIIGESFSPRHSSLYGYEKMTNPLLQGRYNLGNGNLHIFYNVTSPSTHTLAAFRYLLNTHTLDMDSTMPWYKSTTLIEVLEKAGYHTVWFSNQMRYGRWDNIPAAHSRLCDESVFITDETGSYRYDGELLDCEPAVIGKRNAVFYHLTGQHIVFSERYPKQYAIFQPSDYNDTARETAQRQTLAEYDNATLYNDYVVNAIIEKYDDTDAAIFYFSDHGLDIYDTDSDYCGHAITAIPESVSLCREIPFMIYLSPKYMDSRPEMAERIRNSSRNEFCLDKLVYVVMECAGIKFAFDRSSHHCISETK